MKTADGAQDSGHIKLAIIKLLLGRCCAFQGVVRRDDSTITPPYDCGIVYLVSSIFRPSTSQGTSRTLLLPNTAAYLPPASICMFLPRFNRALAAKRLLSPPLALKISYQNPLFTSRSSLSSSTSSLTPIKCNSFSSTTFKLTAKMNAAELANYLADSPPSAVRLEIKKHFDALNEKQKLYAHYISRYVHSNFTSTSAQLKHQVPLTGHLVPAT